MQEMVAGMRGQPIEDRGLKDFFCLYPLATIQALAPDLLATWGRPASAMAIQQEHPLPDLADPSRFHDLALLASWGPGQARRIVLIEHWSKARDVDLDRVLWYYAALRIKHTQVDVVPIVLVTERTRRAASRAADQRGRARPHPRLPGPRRPAPPARDAPRLRQLRHNRVAALFLAVALPLGSVERGLAAMRAMHRARGPIDHLRRFLPLVEKLARMNDTEQARFRQRLREDRAMRTFLDDIKDEGIAIGKAKGRAEGKAQGKAQGKVALLLRLLARGLLVREDARGQLLDLIASREIPKTLGRAAIARLGARAASPHGQQRRRRAVRR